MVSQLEILEALRCSKDYTATRQELVRVLITFHNNNSTSSLDNSLATLTKRQVIRKIKADFKIRNSPVQYQLTRGAIKYLNFISKRSGYVSFIEGNQVVEMREIKLNRKFWRPPNIQRYASNLSLPPIIEKVKKGV